MESEHVSHKSICVDFEDITTKFYGICNVTYVSAVVCVVYIYLHWHPREPCTSSTIVYVQAIKEITSTPNLYIYSQHLAMKVKVSVLYFLRAITTFNTTLLTTYEYKCR